jgi:hypothetical protein
MAKRKLYRIKATDNATTLPGQPNFPVGEYIRQPASNPSTAGDGALGGGFGAAPRRGVTQTGEGQRLRFRDITGGMVSLPPNATYSPSYKNQQTDTRSVLQKIWETLNGGSTDPEIQSGVLGVRGALPASFNKGPHVNASLAVPDGGGQPPYGFQNPAFQDWYKQNLAPAVSLAQGFGNRLQAGPATRRPGDVTGIFSQGNQINPAVGALSPYTPSRSQTELISDYNKGVIQYMSLGEAMRLPANSGLTQAQVLQKMQAAGYAYNASRGGILGYQGAGAEGGTGVTPSGQAASQAAAAGPAGEVDYRGIAKGEKGYGVARNKSGHDIDVRAWANQKRRQTWKGHGGGLDKPGTAPETSMTNTGGYGLVSFNVASG